MRKNDVPQTVDEAREFGWAWMTVRCLTCRRGHDQRFDDLAGRHPPLRLSTLAARFVCKQCDAKRLQFELGVYVTNEGPPWQRRRLVEFQNGVAVHPSRE